MKTSLLLWASITMMALALTACGQGPAGANGSNGHDGAAGIAGTNGTNGTNGTDGTIVLPVQFCPGVVATYPTTFPEYGFCISGKIYAVYSANDGFLTVIPDGEYSSNAVGSSCSFHVTGCTIN